MLLPQLNTLGQTRDFIDTFGGYNHNIRISESEFYDMKNLTSTHYPVLAPREKRGKYELASNGEHHINGLLSKDTLCYVDGNDFYFGNSRIEGLNLDAGETVRRQLVSMGAYVIIFPDKKYYNTKSGEYGNIEYDYSCTPTDTSPIKYEMCRIDGTVYSNYTESATAPLNPVNGQLWLDNSGEVHSLKQFSESTGMWTGIATTYVKITAPQIAAGLKEGDGVVISGMEHSQLTEFNGKAMYLYGAYHIESNENESADSYIIVQGFIDSTFLQTSNTLTVTRKMPDMDFVIESNNRLWGCRYGTNAHGDVVNEIYASKLGDFKNWNVFIGTSTDSYIVSLGSDGVFTGAVNYLGYPTFFKENCIHKVYGAYPAQYQLQTTNCRGVQDGCAGSLAIVNEQLFYKSRNAVMVYDGSLPTEISSYMGEDRFSGIDDAADNYSGACAGAINNKYYISMKSDFDGKWYMFVYDTALRVWHKEDETHALQFERCRNELYFIPKDRKSVISVLGSGIRDTEKIQWMAEGGIIGCETPDKKYVSRVDIRIQLSVGTEVKVTVQYDNTGEWLPVLNMVGTSLRSFTMPIRPKRCDHFRLKIEGTGDAKIFSVSKTLEQGSDY